MILSLFYGRRDQQDLTAKEKAYAMVAEFVGRFQEVNGKKRCQDLLALEISHPEDLQVYRERNLKISVCTAAVLSAVRIAVELILEDGDGA